jgi:hypothetical protein
MDFFVVAFDQIRHPAVQIYVMNVNDFVIHQLINELHVNVLYQHYVNVPNDVQHHAFEIVDYFHDKAMSKINNQNIVKCLELFLTL